MALNIDLFKLFSEKLRKENTVVVAYYSRDVESLPVKRKIMLEVELDDNEYRQMVLKALNDRKV